MAAKQVVLCGRFSLHNVPTVTLRAGRLWAPGPPPLPSRTASRPHDAREHSASGLEIIAINVKRQFWRSFSFKNYKTISNKKSYICVCIFSLRKAHLFSFNFLLCERVCLHSPTIYLILTIVDEIRMLPYGRNLGTEDLSAMPGRAM